MFTRESRALMQHHQPATTFEEPDVHVEPEIDSKVTKCNTQTSPSSPVPLQVRSTKGCWTCRLRKKKCDEIQPHCQRCTSVNIKCHFGRKPAWIENPIQGKSELERIKPAIAASASRKRAAFREKSKLAVQTSPAKSETTPQLLDLEFTDAGRQSIDNDGATLMEVNYDDAPGDDQEHDTPSSVIDAPSLIETVSPISNRYDQEPYPTSSSIIDRPSPVRTTSQNAIESKRTKEFGGDEANLMMHYLDNVFYIQFRFYTPSITAGGRGWLLSLLNRTKPLYHAALSLSAFHQQSLISQQGADQAQIDYLHQLELHHNLTLEELQLFIHAHTENTFGDGFGGKVQILACMVQLISFELFNGGTGKWQVHLGAASKLILELQSMREASSAEYPSQDTIQVTNQSNMSLPNIAAFDFFASAIIWFDIVACVSTGSSPHLAEHYHSLLAPSPIPRVTDDSNAFQLQLLMGCQNWAMITIGQIGVLANAHHEDNLNIHELARAAKDIQRRLEFHNAQTFAALRELQHEYHGAPPHYLSSVYTRYTTLVVTHVFASAAVLYLQTIITAAPTVFHIQEPLQDVMRAMSLIPDPRMVRGMVWPLCVAGCMASSSVDQEFFREKADGAVRDAGMVGNSGKATEILEMSWELQRVEGRLVDCATCIRKLGTCVLLA